MRTMGRGLYVTQRDLQDLVSDFREELRLAPDRAYGHLAELFLILLVFMLVETAVIVWAVWYFR